MEQYSKEEVLSYLYRYDKTNDTDRWEKTYLYGISSGVIKRDDILNLYPVRIAMYEQEVKRKEEILKSSFHENFTKEEISKIQKYFVEDK